MLGFLPLSLWALVGFWVAVAVAASLFWRPVGEGPERQVDVVIVSRAGRAQWPSLRRSLEWHAERFGRVWLVIDSGAEMEREARELARRLGVHVVTVPEWFDCGSRGKARALAWFARMHGGRRCRWYAFIDDDNLILDKRFTREVAAAEERGLLVGNPVLVPRPGRSWLAFVADHVRLLDDLTLFRAFTGVLGRPFAGLHGELLIVRGDVLGEVGVRAFCRDTLVEDYAFAVEAWRLGYRFWQSATRVSILSPHSLRDFLRQRRRWFCGLWEEVKRSPLPFKLVAGARVLVWRVGLLGAMALLPVWWLLGVGVPGWLAPFTIAGLAYYVAAYGLGAYRLARLTGGLRGAALGLLALLGAPLYGLLENLAPLMGCTREFEVIEK